ncbi:uncharacterized protein METZ01_LOCUS470843 [marine metagenome]|uniref:Uncharacterized protein n=1 Tax=marine metagenome TaxID=408172 RepID=A0A383BDT8_9ZZZZ
MLVEKFMTDSEQESKGLWKASSVNPGSVRVGPGVTEVETSKSQANLHSDFHRAYAQTTD